MNSIDGNCIVMSMFDRVIWIDDECDGKTALGSVVDVKEQFDIDGVIGLPCSTGQSVDF